MPEHFPFALTFALFFCLGMCRGQATYWLARLVTQRALRADGPPRGPMARWQQRFAGLTIGRGADLLRRWGLGAVSLCYLTIGIQTVIIATAGVLRIRWWRFTAAQVPGVLAWALIYTTIGFAVWAAAWRTALREHPVVAAALLLIVVGLVVFGVRRRRARRRAHGDTPDEQEPPHGAAGGGRGIRTHDDVAAITVFKTVALGHYASPPSARPEAVRTSGEYPRA